MTYDPNSDQEQQFLPEMQQDDSMPAPQEDLPADAPVSEDQAVSREEMIQEPDFIGSYADNTIPEGQEPDTGYRGKFAARPSVPPSESSDDFPASEPEQLSVDSPEQEDIPPAEEPVYSDDNQQNTADPEQPVFQDGMSGIPPQDPLPPYPGDFEEELPPVPEQPRPHRTRAIKKGRPRRKKGEGLFGIPNILVTGVWVALVLLISITLGRMVWVCASEILAFGREDKSVTITVYETDTIDDITKKLARAELIHYPGLFKLYAQFAVDEGDIHPGMWDLNTKYDYHALVKMMSPSSSRSTVKVMIPEGYTCRQIFALLEENKVCTVQDISSYSAYGELNDYWFLDGVTRGDKYCLEGFLFPDTYEFYQNDTPKNVLTKMLNNFDNRFDEEMRGKIQTLNAHLTDLMRRDGKTQDYIDSHLFTVRDVVNVASMIEK